MELAVAGVMLMVAAGFQPRDVPAPAAPTAPVAPAAVTEPVAPISFERTTMDLGVISDFDVSTQTFAFVNNSASPVRIQIGGCHFCGVPTSDKAVYQPGDRGIIFVEVNPAGRRGVMRAGGTVSVAGLEGFHVNVEVTAVVRPRVWFEPDMVVIPPVPRGASPVAEFRVCGRSERFAVISAKCETPNAVVQVSPLERVDAPGDPHACCPVRVTLPTGLSIGSHEVSVALETSDERDSRRAMSFAIEVVGELVASPDAANLGRLAPGEAFVSSLMVQPRLGGPIRVVSLEVQERGLFEDVAIDSAPTPFGVRVSLAGRAPKRQIQWTQAVVAVRSRAADGEEEVLLVPFGGSVSEQPRPR